ncbi:MAG: hypothetical protein WC244_04470 [Patescibacteria group bacterium]|jgi:hypothetical protein
MKSSFKRIVGRTIDDIATLFPYLLIFYIVIIILSYFFIPARSFFYWPGLNISILFLAVISFVSPKGRYVWEHLSFKSYLVFLKQSLNFVKSKAVLFFCKLITLSRLNKIKIISIILVVILVLVYKVSFFDWLVLIYGLTIIFFSLWSRTPAVFALILLILCPILLILKMDSVAENVAIYAYYFLIITVVVGIMELVVKGRVAEKK